MASQLLNHLGASAVKYCRIGMVCIVMYVYAVRWALFCTYADRDDSPHVICTKRTLQTSLQQMAVIRSQRTLQLKDEHHTLYGVREDSNPLLHIPGDFSNFTML